MVRYKNLAQTQIDSYYSRINVRDILGVRNVEIRPDCGNIRIILNKFKKADIVSSVLDICQIVHCERDHKRLTKQELVDKIVKLCEQNDVQEIEQLFLVLHLKYIQLYYKKKTKIWAAAKIKNAKNKLRRETEPEKFTKVLLKHVHRNYNCRMLSSKENDAMWSVIFFANESPRTGITYLVAFPGNSLILYSKTKEKYVKSMKSALKDAFRGVDVEMLDVKGKNILTVAHFGSLACVPENDQPLPPSFEFPLQKRAKQDIEYSQHIINGCIEEDNEKEAYLQQHFDEDIPPDLHSVTFNMQTDFCGIQEDEELEEMSTTIRVVLKGENILEGYYQFIQDGQAVYPLPEHVSIIKRFGCSTFSAVQNS